MLLVSLSMKSVDNLSHFYLTTMDCHLCSGFSSNRITIPVP